MSFDETFDLRQRCIICVVLTNDLFTRQSSTAIVHANAALREGCGQKLRDRDARCNYSKVIQRCDVGARGWMDYFIILHV